MSKRIYIAGPMSGYDQFNFPAFDAARDQLRSEGYEVVSPADLSREIWRRRDELLNEFNVAYRPSPAELAEFMADDLAELGRCDAVYLLPGWEKSKGVAVELAYANYLGIEVMHRPEPVVSPLDEAKRLVHGDRGDDYGHPYDDFSRTARMWSALLGTKLVAGCHVSAAEVGLCMIALKLSREVNRPKLDNLTDIAGYAETVAMVHSESKRRGA